MKNIYLITKKTIVLSIIATLFSLLPNQSYSQINAGTYTIGGTNPDFSSFSQVVNKIGNEAFTT